MKNSVFITASGSISALGGSLDESVNSLKKEIQPIHFPVTGDAYTKPWFPLPRTLLDAYPDTIIECSRQAFVLIDQVIEQLQSLAPLPLFMATSTGGIRETEEIYRDLVEQDKKYPLFTRHFFDAMSTDIHNRYPNLISECYTFSTACSSAGHAIAQASRFISQGTIERALVIGVDSLSYTTMIGFDSLKLVSETGTKPLTMERDGLSLGEGAGLLLLESENSLSSDPLAEILGYSSTSDGFHISSPDPEGTQQERCVREALASASLTPSDVTYINAHGTGTEINDRVELSVIEKVFDRNVTVSSLKTFTGHTLGASAIVEIPLVLQMAQKGKIYQPKGLGTPISTLVPAESMQKKISTFVKNAFGFGGNNVSLVIKPAE
jgi:3-oxoacyl-[acyl-carrier-protein] synthase-1